MFKFDVYLQKKKNLSITVVISKSILTALLALILYKL